MMIGYKHIKLERETTPISARVKVTKNIVIPPDCVLYLIMQGVFFGRICI